MYNREQQGSFAKHGGSVGYGGIYPIYACGRPSGGPPSGPGYGHGGGYGGFNNTPPKSFNERTSDDEGGGDYEFGEYDEPSNEVSPGGRQKGHGGSNYEGNSEGNNYDYGDPVQNGGLPFF